MYSVVLYCEPGKLCMFVYSRVGHIDVSIGSVVRINRETKQAFLVRAISVYRSKRRRQNRSVPIDQDGSRLLTDKNVTRRSKTNYSWIHHAARQLRLGEARWYGCSMGR